MFWLKFLHLHPHCIVHTYYQWEHIIFSHHVEDMIEFRCYDGSIRFDGVCGRQCPGGRLSTLGSTFWTAFAHILEFYHCEG